MLTSMVPQRSGPPRSSGADLVKGVLRMPVKLRGELSEQIIFHKDRDTQGASERIFRLAKDKGLVRSMGHAGVCRHNAMAESVFATLKNELYWRRMWLAKKRARTDVGKWIDAARPSTPPRFTRPGNSGRS